MADNFIYIDSADGRQKSVQGSTGGNGAADVDKVVRFGGDGNGTLVCTDSFRVQDSSDANKRAIAMPSGMEVKNHAGNFLDLLADTTWYNSGSGNHQLFLPAASGTLALETATTSHLAGNVFLHPPATSSSSASTGVGQTIPADNTIPQNTEGAEYLTITITPKHASSTLIIEFTCYTDCSVAGSITVALFVDSTANALCAVARVANNLTRPETQVLRYSEPAGSTSSRTYKIRFGPNSGTAYMQRYQSGDVHSTAKQAVLTVTEILP